MGRLGHHPHVVGDEDQRHAALALQVQQQVDDLGLDGDIQRGGRFVGDQQARIAGDRHGDHHSLVHAAGELMGKRRQARCGARDTDLLQQLDGTRAAGGFAAALMHVQCLHDLESDGEARVEASRRLLKDHRDVFAGDAPALGGGHGQQVLAVEDQAIGRHLAGPGDQAHQRQHGDALARAGFADHAHDLSLVDGKIQPVDGAQGAARGLELDGEVLDLDQGHQRFNFGSSASRNPSPMRLKASTVIRMASPGNVTTQGARCI